MKLEDMLKQQQDRGLKQSKIKAKMQSYEDYVKDDSSPRPYNTDNVSKIFNIDQNKISALKDVESIGSDASIKDTKSTDVDDSIRDTKKSSKDSTIGDTKSASKDGSIGDTKSTSKDSTIGDTKSASKDASIRDTKSSSISRCDYVEVEHKNCKIY